MFWNSKDLVESYNEIVHLFHALVESSRRLCLTEFTFGLVLVESLAMLARPSEQTDDYKLLTRSILRRSSMQELLPSDYLLMQRKG